MRFAVALLLLGCSGSDKPEAASFGSGGRSELVAGAGGAGAGSSGTLAAGSSGSGGGGASGRAGAPGAGDGGTGGAGEAGDDGGAGEPAAGTGGATTGGMSGAGGAPDAGRAGAAPAGAGGRAGGSGGIGGGAGAGGKAAAGGAGAGGAAGTGGAAPSLDPQPAENCPGFVDYYVPVGTCIWLQGEWEVETPECDLASSGERSGCATTTARDAGPQTVRLKPGDPLVVTRFDLEDGTCPKVCSATP
jgi:hypothetical protein